MLFRPMALPSHPPGQQSSQGARDAAKPPGNFHRILSIFHKPFLCQRHFCRRHFLHEDIGDEARGEVGRAEHTRAHGQCLESQVQRMAARAPRLMSVYPMGCARKMLIREQVAQRLMETILHHMTPPPTDLEMASRNTSHGAPH